MKHKHYDCIVAWAEGKKIEIKMSTGDWVDVTWFPQFATEYEYRIKKEPVIEVKYIKLNSDFTYMLFDVEPENYSLKITYHDGVAIKAEVAEIDDYIKKAEATK